jgi:hypothetical protein
MAWQDEVIIFNTRTATVLAIQDIYYQQYLPAAAFPAARCFAIQ